jgi:LysR family glycine cleavage system transcriptional activator
MTTSRTPPLPALRAFAALVRLGSVAAAAQELSLTTGAVTHQIRALESFLNVALVQRDSRSLTLTEEGRIYGYQVRQALEVIAQASERLVRPRRSSRARALRVAVLPSFAHGWLIARLTMSRCTQDCSELR